MKATITKSTELDLKQIHAWRNVRSDLAHQIERYWVGQTKSNVGLQYLEFKDGVLHNGRYSFERRDLMVFQHMDAFNVFVEPNGSLNWNLFDGIEITPEEKAKVEKHIRKELERPDIVAYFEHERRFFAEKPWEQVHGMTPEQAVAKFKELGWY